MIPKSADQEATVPQTAPEDGVFEALLLEEHRQLGKGSPRLRAHRPDSICRHYPPRPVFAVDAGTLGHTDRAVCNVLRVLERQILDGVLSSTPHFPPHRRANVFGRAQMGEAFYQ